MNEHELKVFNLRLAANRDLLRKRAWEQIDKDIQMTVKTSIKKNNLGGDLLVFIKGLIIIDFEEGSTLSLLDSVFFASCFLKIFHALPRLNESRLSQSGKEMRQAKSSLVHNYLKGSHNKGFSLLWNDSSGSNEYPQYNATKMVWNLGNLSRLKNPPPPKDYLKKT